MSAPPACQWSPPWGACGRAFSNNAGLHSPPCVCCKRTHILFSCVCCVLCICVHPSSPASRKLISKVCRAASPWHTHKAQAGPSHQRSPRLTHFANTPLAFPRLATPRPASTRLACFLPAQRGGQAGALDQPWGPDCAAHHHLPRHTPQQEERHDRHCEGALCCAMLYGAALYGAVMRCAVFGHNAQCVACVPVPVPVLCYHRVC